jgi:hypothetical protein
MAVLVCPDLELLIQNRTEFLSQTIFAPLFSQFSPDDIEKMYSESSEDYQDDLNSIQNKFIVVGRV